MRKTWLLTAPARCGSAHRGLLAEVNRETGAGRTSPVRRIAHDPSREQHFSNQPATMTDERAPRSVRGDPRPA